MRFCPSVRGSWVASMSCVRNWLSFLGLALALAVFSPLALGQAVKKNRLAQETSPYLLQHAENPVDWFPWGPEAFARAKSENKVIFLSVGYSSCHWCHVMEAESFKDSEIAAVLNEHFICIKVDREERPDVDAVYMTALQAYAQLSGNGGGGGWPMSVFLLPDGRPFFGGTYFPARDGDRGVRMGFLTLAKTIQRLWKEKPAALQADAELLTKVVRDRGKANRAVPLEPIPTNVAELVVESLREQYDRENGGFGTQPKFPEPSNLLFLLHLLESSGQDEALRAKAEVLLRGTLDGMARGGIRDHLGGGFHRYSVDRYWRIPHFEKMLYDNAQLASVYSRAFALFQEPSYRQVVEEVLEFIDREMSSEEGAFYSALDADSEHEEGKFYRWTSAEVKEVVGEADFPLVSRVFGLDQPPNFEEEFYALQYPRSFPELAETLNQTPQQLHQQLLPLRERLLARRNQRVRPATDTKILTAWNGLMIRGLADAGRCLQEPRYVARAERAADFLLAHLRQRNGRLFRTYSRGEAKLNGYLDDYAFLAHGLLGLFEATGQQRWLREAETLTEQQLALFWDDSDGGFFFTSHDHEDLIVRTKNPVDGALPAGNSLAAANLVYLGKTLEKPNWLDRARMAVRSVAAVPNLSLAAAPQLVVVFQELPPETP